MSEMNALVLEGVADLKYKKVPRPVAKAGEVLVRIRACGICSSDIPRIFKTGTYHFPTIPGHEFAGEIVEVGEGVDASYIGKRAAVFPLLPCGECEPCVKQKYAQCKNYNYFGSRCDGGFSEYLAVPVWNLLPFSDKLSYEEGALCEPLATGIHAFKLSKMERGQTVTVVGTGTIGFMIAEAARISGAARVIICGRSANKLEFAQRLGFDILNVNNDDFDARLKQLTNSDGANVVFECVGSPESINQAVACCGAFGRIVLVGNPTGDITFSKNVYWKILRQQLEVAGTWNSSFSETVNDWKDAVKLLESGAVDFKQLISETYDLHEFEKAFESLRDPDVFTIKVMFKMQGD